MMRVATKRNDIALANKLGLSPHHLQLICQILTAHPHVQRAWVFGSRAIGSHKPSSDIDIAIEGQGITLADQANILDQLYHSTLPFKVDLVVKHQISSAELLEHIEQYGVHISSENVN